MLKSFLRYSKLLFSNGNVCFNRMIRTDKELHESEICEIMEEANIVRLGLYDEELNLPYIVPMNYGFDKNNLHIYLHSGNAEGKRTKIIRKNSSCCFEVDISGGAEVPDGPGCDSTMNYRSVIGYGEVSFIEDYNEKVSALRIIMEQNAPESMKERKDWGFIEKAVKATTVIKIEVNSWTGKQSPPPERDHDDL